MATLTVNPNNIELKIDEDQSLLDVLRSKDIYIRSSCGGTGSCGDCKIKVSGGADYINTPSFEEIQLLGNVFHLTKERLSCQTCITGDVTIDISAHDLKSDQEKSRSKSGHRPKTKRIKKGEERERQELTGKKKERVDGMRRPKFFQTPDEEETEAIENKEIKKENS